MTLDATTAVRWGSVEDVLEKLSKRNRKFRVINDSLVIHSRGNDPMYCWDGEGEEWVWIRKQDWLKASPAIRTTEACILLRITPAWFKRRRDELGIKPKRSAMGKKDLPVQGFQVYYSLNDIIEISRELPTNKFENGPADEHEIRKLFARGYVTYKLSKSGEYLPVWDESIF